jgi:hypothetical protein
MCEVTYLVMVRNIHLSTYNNNIQKKKKSIMKIILIIINIASLIYTSIDTENKII